MQLCRDVGLGIQKSFQPGLFHLLYFKEFYLVVKVRLGFVMRFLLISPVRRKD
jgi:hypothetical protein